MRAVLCRQYGTPDVLAIEEIDPPAMKPGHVRIAVATSAVTFASILGIAGKHQNRPGLPYVPGGEVTGTVMEVAPDVADLKPGDRVVALVRSGGYAEQAVAPWQTTWRVPDELDPVAAALVASTYAGIFASLDWMARLQPGETLLVHGAGGGSGLGAVIVGHAMGARVLATAGTAAKRETALRFGAETAIDYRAEDVRQRVLDLTDGRGANVVFDPVGGDLFDQSLRCVAPEARMIPYGFASGAIPHIPANLLLVKNVTVIGFYWGYYLGWAKQRPPQGAIERVRRTMDQLTAWVASGRLAQLPTRRYPVEEFREAMRQVSDREAIGKIILTL